ncbi:MAG TPA: YIP1 family protein [Caldilineae bacterium]|nr:YIP1 family protein [Caldilineae bacterium]
MDTSSLTSRMIRAAKLDVSLFEEVEHDTSLDQQALLVVIIAAAAAGIGALLAGIIGGVLGGLLGADIMAVGGGFMVTIFSTIWVVVFTVIGYYIWAFVTQWVGTNLFEGTADFGEVKRALGYAYAPQVLNVFSFIPCLGTLLSFVTSIWTLAAAFYALREALDLDSTKTIITLVIGWVIIMVISFLIASLIGGAGMLAGGILS